MKQPTYKGKLIDFTVSKNHCRKHKINPIIASLPVLQWSNIEQWINAEFESGKNKSANCQACLNKVVRCLSLISSTLYRYPDIQTFAAQVERYLKTPSVKAQFEEIYQQKYNNCKIKKNKQILNQQTCLISQTEVILENRTNLSQLEARVSYTGSSACESVSTPSESSESLTSPIVSRPMPSISSVSTLSTSSASEMITIEPESEMHDIKEVIFNHASKLHYKYQRGGDLSTEELEAMSKGLSCILDLGELEKEGNTRQLFSEDLWTKLTAKYTNRFKAAPCQVDISLIDKWKHIVNLYKNQNNIRKAKKFINYLKSQDSLNEKDERVLDLYEEILFLAETKEFLLSSTNSPKVSEGDFVFQIWLPIFCKLFNINKNIVRIKAGETVPGNTTESKSNLYNNHKNIIGFKTDLRILVDFEEEELDLVCGEGCLWDANNQKVIGDISKLSREGKEAEVAIQRIYNNTKHNSIESKAWLCLMIGPQCIFSTIHPTKHQYHVVIPEFSLSFPTSFLGSNGIRSLKSLFSFRDSVEQIALGLKKILGENRDHINMAKNASCRLSLSPERSNVIPEATWFTPPHSDRRQSRIPSHSIYESGIESDDDDNYDNDGDKENQEEYIKKPDIYGLIKNSSGWLDPTTGTEYTTHPYHI